MVVLFIFMNDIYIGYSKEREEEFRQYWDKEIRDQRKWTRGMNLF